MDNGSIGCQTGFMDSRQRGQGEGGGGMTGYEGAVICGQLWTPQQILFAMFWWGNRVESTKNEGKRVQLKLLETVRVSTQLKVRDESAFHSGFEWRGEFACRVIKIFFLVLEAATWQPSELIGLLRVGTTKT